MGRRLIVEWGESEAELKARYRQERHPQRRTRLQALWLLRQGHSLQEVSQVVGVHYRTVQDWVGWYRAGGLKEVLRRVVGYSSRGQPARLSPLQQRALVRRVAQGVFKTVWEIIAWVKQRWGVAYSYTGMHTLLRRHRAHPKAPRPHAAKADAAQQAEWKKGG